MRQRVGLKKAIKKIDFDIMINGICDISVIYDKLIKSFNEVKKCLISLSHWFNEIGGGYPTLYTFINDHKSFLKLYEPIINQIKTFKFMKDLQTYKEEVKTLEDTFRQFSRPENQLVKMMMHFYKTFKVCDINNNDWISETKSIIYPFYDINNIQIYMLYSKNKSLTIERIKSIFQASETFYKIYILPNFNLESAIENIKEYVMEMHHSGAVACNLIPAYIKKVASQDSFDIQKMNLAYLETDNKNTFVINLMSDMLSTESTDIKPDPSTLIQIRSLLNYLSTKNANSSISSTILAGQSMLDLSD